MSTAITVGWWACSCQSNKTDVLDDTAVMAGPSMLVEDSCVNSDNSGMMGLLLSVEQDGCVR